MKKLVMLLIMLASLTLLTAYAEAPAQEPAAALLPFEVTLPADVSVQENAGGTSVTFLHGNGLTRVVAMVLERVPDENGDHAAELIRLMGQFAPEAGDYRELVLSDTFYGLMAITPGALEGVGGTRIDQVTVMVLRQTAMEGELLILSGYDMKGDISRAWTLVDALLTSAAVDGVPVVPPVEELALPQE